MSVYDVLAQAIEERRVVTFTYDGFLRVVEPFAVLLSFDFRGETIFFEL